MLVRQRLLRLGGAQRRDDECSRADDEGRFRTPLLNEGESATFTAPTQPGTYKFSCTVHAQMQGIGTLIVHD